MILGRSAHPPSACFDEIETAVASLTDRTVVFNAHAFPADVPAGAIIYQTENVPGQIPDPRALWPHHEIWDISAASAARYGATYVPIGFHPTMQRFTRAAEPDIDIAFTGCMNPRRADILQQLADRGLKVAHIGPNGPHGIERDAVLARAKLALNVLFYPDGIFPVLRAAHLVANRVPVLSEVAPETPGWAGPGYAYGDIVERAMWLLSRPAEWRAMAADDAFCAFRAVPMVLP